jgi:hypothetical protein
MYNAAQEGLYGPSKSDRSAFDLFALCPGIKLGFLKFCNHHEQRIRMLLPFDRVGRTDEDENTCITVPGFITEWKAKGKNALKAMKVDLQFLHHHCMQYLDLHKELSKIDHSPQWEAALTNFKLLLILEISLLLGCYFEWTAPAAATAAAAAVDEEQVQINHRN